MKTDVVRKEIGSEFWDVPTGGSGCVPFPVDTRWFISGTSALEYIICDIQKNNKLERVGIPSWCCSCMILPFVNAGIETVFYSVYVDTEGNLVCDYENVSQCDATLVLTYFGYNELKTRGCPSGILIRDLTHSLFCDTYSDAQYYFGSLRKWTGVWTGGYAWKQGNWNNSQSVPAADASFLQCRANAMSMKLEYLQGHIDQKNYLTLFENAEDFLDQCGIMGSCDRDIHCAMNLNVAFMRERRRENAQVILSELKNMALFSRVDEKDCPMFVPILLADKKSRDDLRRYLTSNEVYCPIHWPVTSWHVLNEKERYLYDHSLSVVCDHRYNAADMMRVVDLIKEYIVV